MKIVKILNNSSAIVLEDGVEKIILGKGIVFGKKNGDIITPTNVEKKYIIESEKEKERLTHLIQNIPDHYFDIVEEIVTYAELILQSELNFSIHFTLADHIHFTLKRYQDGIFPTNALKYDIKRYYNKEYQIAEKAVDLLEDEFNIQLNDDEVASIALHIVNAEFNLPMQESVQFVQLVDHIIQIIKYYLQIDFDTESIHYQRLLTHLRFFVWRIARHEQHQNDNKLFDIVKESYPRAYQCTLRVKKFVESTYDYQLSKDEMTYLTVHIQKLIES